MSSETEPKPWERETKGPVLGECRAWLDDEGWGVLSSPDVEGEVWALFPMIMLDNPNVYRSLEAGERVRFTYETPGQDGYPHRAVEVWPLDRST